MCTYVSDHTEGLSGRERVANPLVARWGGRDRDKAGGRVAARLGGGGGTTPRLSHFYDELFYRACCRFSFSIFYVYFPETINYV